MNPPFFYVQLRNGQPAIARALTNEESAPPWGLIGLRRSPEKYFAIGDPELWFASGHWREDREPHPFDILIAGGIVNFGQLSVGTPPNQAPLPEDSPAQEHPLETIIRKILETHGSH